MISTCLQTTEQYVGISSGKTTIWWLENGKEEIKNCEISFNRLSSLIKLLPIKLTVEQTDCFFSLLTNSCTCTPLSSK